MASLKDAQVPPANLKDMVQVPAQNVFASAPPTAQPDTFNPYAVGPTPSIMTTDYDRALQFRRSGVSQFRIAPLPLKANPQIGASARTIAEQVLGSSTTVQSGMNFRGLWLSTANYQVNDVILFNQSAYIASQNNINVEPDTAPVSTIAVRQTATQGGTGGSTLNVTFASGVQPGSTILVAVMADNITNIESATITDTLGNTYNKVVASPAVDSGQYWMILYMASNVAGGACTVTCVFPATGGPGNDQVFIAEVTGLGNLQQPDAYTSAASFTPSGGTPPPSLIVPCNNAADLIFAAQNTDGTSLTAPTGFTSLLSGGKGIAWAQAAFVGNNVVNFGGSGFRNTSTAVSLKPVLNPSVWTLLSENFLFSVPATAGQFNPYEVVQFRGSMYVCVKPTAGDPFTTPSSWVLLAQGTGSVDIETANYTAVAADYGRLVSFNSSSALTFTLPATPPSNSWWVAVQNIGNGVLTVSRNGLNINGSASNITLNQNQGLIIFTDGSNYFSLNGFGTVFSVALAAPSIFTVSGSPITGSGTLTLGLATENANTFWGGPTSGAAATPTFRTIIPNDIPVGNVNAQTASYLAVSADSGKLVSFNSAAAVTLTLPAAAPSTNWYILIENVGAGALTVSRNGLNIDGAATNLVLNQNQGVIIYTDGTNYFTMRGMGTSGGSGSGQGVVGVNPQTGNYLAVVGDEGKLVSFTIAAPATLTLPATPPAAGWWIDVEDVSTSALTINPNGNQLDGSSSSLVISPGIADDLTTLMLSKFVC